MQLADVQPGDILVMRTYGIGQGRSLVKIGRTTKTQLITTRDKRFRKRDGRQIGRRLIGDVPPSISIPRDGEIEAVQAEQRHRQLVNILNMRLTALKLRELPLEVLEILNTALEEVNAKSTTS